MTRITEHGFVKMTSKFFTEEKGYFTGEFMDTDNCFPEITEDIDKSLFYCGAKPPNSWEEFIPAIRVTVTQKGGKKTSNILLKEDA
jgi:hypothetical protein